MTESTNGASNRFEHALAGTQLGIWDWNILTGEAEFNDRWAEIIGYRLADLEPVSIQTWLDLAHPDDLAASNAAVEAHARGEVPYYDVRVRMRHRDGHWVWVRDRGRIVSWTEDGAPLRMVGTHEDVTAAVLAEQAMSESMLIDPVTHILNRAGFIATAGRRLERNGHLAGGLIVLDLDRFQGINESFGTTVGDRILAEAAARINDVSAADDVVARIGSDEFAKVCSRVDDPDDLERAAMAIQRALCAPYPLPDGREVFTSASVGYTMVSGRTDVDVLLQEAGAALKAAKAKRMGTIRGHEPELAALNRSRLELEARLRRAWESRAFTLHFQPQVRISDRAIVAVEALLRWTASDGSSVPPAAFIPLAEDIGLISEIGAWVIDECCRHGRIWLDAGLPPVTVCANVSSRQLHDEDLPIQVLSSSAAHGFPVNRLELEITESTLLEPGESTLDLLAEIRSIGARLAVDDFGIGYSSFGYIQRYPLDTLKIDQSFVRHLEHQTGDVAICSAIISLGHAFRMQVVAEGVETDAQLAILDDLGCDIVQGYLFGRPMPSDELRHALAARSADG